MNFEGTQTFCLYEVGEETTPSLNVTKNFRTQALKSVRTHILLPANDQPKRGF